ncbi:MAG: triphosphoribosyl-dephospho-CoA synthase [Planctomycetaceae bacterium]|nr:triphosphoribosyl-dephospho-CoA synthase [Planctomycetaceae bacterium]
MTEPGNATRLTIGECATLACLWECTAAKPGNVHRGADFEDATYLDFVLSAQAIGPVFDRAAELRVGELVLAAVEATQRFVRHNTNLGMLLLFGPLARVPLDQPLQAGVADVLKSLDERDSQLVYEAIRRAKPGGLGKVDQADVQSTLAPPGLLDAMRLAADRDSIARQYVTGFVDLWDRVVPFLIAGLDRGWPLQTTIIHAHVRLLAAQSDTLIARKCGAETAAQASAIARQVLDYGQPGDDEYEQALGSFDFWLRADGHRRNPGTTADLIAAGLLCLLRDGRLQQHVRFYEGE